MMKMDPEKLGPEHKVAFLAIVGALRESNRTGTLQAITLAEAEARASICMLSLMTSGLKVTFDCGEKLDLLLRPGVRATIELLGNFGREDIEKLKRHLDLVAEGLGSICDHAAMVAELVDADGAARAIEDTLP